MSDMDNRKIIRQKAIIKLQIRNTDFNKDINFYRIMTVKLSLLVYCTLGLFT